MAKGDYVPALRFRLLTTIYDPLMERWPAARRMWQGVLQALDPQPGMQLLELGCGPGRLAIDIKRRWPDVTVEALDGDPQILQVARRNAQAAGVDVAFREADITRLDPTRVYDRIYSTLVFHHLKPAGKQAALTAVRRSLSPDGRFIIADFGRAADRLQWLLFSLVGWLDGAENAYPHRNGRFEQALRETFGRVEDTATWRTIFGSVRLFVCHASAAPGKRLMTR